MLDTDTEIAYTRKNFKKEERFLARNHKEDLEILKGNKTSKAKQLRLPH